MYSMYQSVYTEQHVTAVRQVKIYLIIYIFFFLLNSYLQFLEIISASAGPAKCTQENPVTLKEG